MCLVHSIERMLGKGNWGELESWRNLRGNVIAMSQVQRNGDKSWKRTGTQRHECNVFKRRLEVSYGRIIIARPSGWSTMSAHTEVYELLFQTVRLGDENQLIGKTSVIDIPAHKTVPALEEALVQKFHSKLAGEEFDLWMLIPSEDHDLTRIRFPCERLRKLERRFRLSSYWSEAPPDGHLHFLIELLSPPTIDWRCHGVLDGYQSLARFVTLKAGSFRPFDLIAANNILEVNQQQDSNIFGVLRAAKAELGRLFQLPEMPDAVTRAVATSLRNNFFQGRTVNQGRRASTTELLHYHQVTSVPPTMKRFLDNKEAYFNWTYMMPVARGLSQRRSESGDPDVSDFIACAVVFIADFC
ncbi:hypothetical protein BT69DRAFT_1289579 [Atractiella rhizophila]|nr:hypothetical protein BT69DRAFT_1289579 [Atractiella rhizophila]